MTELMKPCDQIHQGMPVLKNDTNNVISFFEFWPSAIIYLPVVFQWLFLSARYRCMTLPLISNPGIPLGGMVGESKSSVLLLAGDAAAQSIAPFISLINDKSIPASDQLKTAMQDLEYAAISFPVIAKPDLGCRGAGVKIIQNKNDLLNYFNAFPDNARLLLQHKVPFEAEAGIFYIRLPGQQHGQIFSMTLKYSPYVIGNGESTLKQLIYADKRAARISDIYLSRHKKQLNTVIGKDIAFRLSFAGAHCKGSIFRNGEAYITDELRQAFDHISHDINGFYYGRFDIRFESIDQLMLGKSFKIIEINGASSEATHIWDKSFRLRDVYKTLFYQYKTLFKIGQLNLQRGVKKSSLWDLLKAWRLESKLVKKYPETD